MSEITLFKLVSGEEIIATVSDKNDTRYVASKAMAIGVVQTGPQQYGLQLYPFLKGSPDGEFELQAHAVMGSMPTPPDLERSYISQTSGIEIATSLSPLLG
jgi:hypothetical protein